MSISAWVYATQDEAQLVIDAITQAQGATEILTPSSVSFKAPRKTWAHPIELSDGTWAVPYGRRLDVIAGLDVVVKGQSVRVLPERARQAIEESQRRSLT